MEGNRKEVKITKSLQALRAGTPGSNNLVLNGCKLLTITFSDAAVNISHIEFCNRYTESVTIAAKFKVQQPPSSGGVKFEWKNLLVKKLMPNSHYATGAESKLNIKSTEFLHDPNDVCSLRIVLRQPSVQFTEFSIENFKVYKSDEAESPSDSLTQWLLTKQKEDSITHTNSIRELPPLEKVALQLQRMWALGKNTSRLRKSSVQPIRFDKDGCYDINLLSY